VSGQGLVDEPFPALKLGAGIPAGLTGLEGGLQRGNLGGVQAAGRLFEKRLENASRYTAA
jgi:hypothetical protein